MIEIHPSLQSAINKRRVSLFPLVKIYKGVRLGEDLANNQGIVNLSTKSATISQEQYLPILLQSPQIRSEADLINRKYKISNLNLKISNVPYKGNKISEELPDLINAVCQIYYTSDSIYNLDECLLVYTGTIRRFSQTIESVSLSVEDVTQQTLSTKVPFNLVPEEARYKKEDQNKPFPMIYGRNYNSPTIRTVYVDPATGIADQNQLLEIVCDAPDTELEGPLSKTVDEAFNIDYTQSGHFLLSDQWLSDDNYYLSINEDGLVPINRIVPKDFNLEGSNYEGSVLYQTDESNRVISLNVLGESSVLLTRLLRKINSASFFVDKVHDTFSTDPVWVDAEAYCYFYGFDYLSGWDPTTSYGGYWYSIGTTSADPAKTEYANNWSDIGNHTWWQPTDINELTTEGSLWADSDQNWYPEDETFPLDFIQNNSPEYGLYMKSISGANTISNNLAGGMVKFGIDPVGDFSCLTRVHYRANIITPNSLVTTEGMVHLGGGNYTYKQIEAVSFPSCVWTEPDTLRYEYDPLYSDNAQDLTNLISNSQTDAEAGNEGNQSPYNLDMQVYIGSDNDETEASTPQNTDNTGESKRLRGYGVINGWNETNRFENIYWGAEKHQGQQFNSNNEYAVRNCNASLNNLHITQDISINDLPQREYFVDMYGRKKHNSTDPAFNVRHFAESIVKNELNADFNIDDLTGDHDLQSGGSNNDWKHAFALGEQMEAKKLLEEMFQSSINMTGFRADGSFSIIPIYQILSYNTTNITHIGNNDVFKFSYEYTKIDDIKNSVNVKYNYDIPNDEFLSQTGYSFTNSAGDSYTTYDEITQSIYPNEPEYHYDINFYNLKDEECQLEFESKYINDKTTAESLQKTLVNWYANQHLIIRADLNISFMNLEAGDYIQFDELLAGEKAFGLDYTKHQNKNGQLIYKYFFITKVSKSLTKVSIHAVQVHRGEYGFFDGWDTQSDSGSTIIDLTDQVDSGGNNGQGNWNNEQGDPFDDPSDDTDEPIEEEEQEYFNVYWNNNDNNLENSPRIVIDTNIVGRYTYKLWLYYNDEIMPYGDNTLPVINDEPYFDYNDYFIVNDNNYNETEDGIKGGFIQIAPRYDIPEQHTDVLGAIQIYYEDENDEAVKILDFYHPYVSPPPIVAGDINQDGIINVLDVVRLVNIILGEGEEPTETELELSDMNSDGIINIQDIIQLINIILP